MFIEEDEFDTESVDNAENDDEEVLISELESIADVVDGGRDLDDLDESLMDDELEGDMPIEQEKVDESVLEEVTDGTGKKP